MSIKRSFYGMMKVAIYARCSTNETKQDLTKQVEILTDHATAQGWTVTKIYSDYASGAKSDREAFNMLLTDAGKKRFNLVLFQDLSRISRQGTLQTLMILEQWKQQGIAFHSLNESFISSLGPFGDVVISIMSTLNKLERERISEKTKAALAIVRRRGVKLGRPEKAQRLRSEIERLKAEGLGASAIAKRLRIARSSVYNVLSLKIETAS